MTPMLTKGLKKLLLLVVFTVVIIVTLIHTEMVPTDTATTQGIKDTVLFYQDMVKNYTSSVVGEIAEGVESITTAIAVPAEIRSLMTPAFEPDSMHPSKASARNRRYISKVLSKKIDEPKGFILPRKEDARANATFVSLVRNTELKGILETIDQIETNFNKKFHYPYVFLNDKPFTEKFKERIRAATESDCFFESVAPEDWERPTDIDLAKEEEGIKYLDEKGVGYARKLSYHNMCRYYSRGFYSHPRMQQFRYYWRLEPKVNYFCDISYDVFKFMEVNDKVYGFVLNLYDSPDSVRTLWPKTMEFLMQNPNYLHPNAATTWLRENLQNPQNFETAKGYSTCHFWSNFEIGDMNFFRGEAYSKWVAFLDKAGGFYYERWGDAPVHSIGLGLFADKSKIHWFRDIGYEHFPYFNCPQSDKCHGRCEPGKFSHYDNLNGQNCQATWVQYEMKEKDLEQY
jgi:mannosyltransferase